MLSSSKIKEIRLLDKKKYRQKYNKFVVEGIKNIKEYIYSNFYHIEKIYSIEHIDFIQEEKVEIIKENILKKISFLKNPKDALAIINIPDQKLLCNTNLEIALDGIQDPGNFGTIIRVADWFGIDQIICSNDTTDLYNPKVIQASMGSISRVNIYYTNLKNYLSNSDKKIYITDIIGKNIYKTSLKKNSIIVMGNEGNGVSKEIKNLDYERLTIPKFSKNKNMNSLNVSIATSIILGHVFSE